MDEMTILLLSFLKALHVISGKKGLDPSDTFCENITFEAYKHCNRPINESISLQDFILFCKYKELDECKDLMILMQSFNLIEASDISEAVAEKAEEPVAEVKEEPTPEPEAVAEKAEDPVA